MILLLSGFERDCNCDIISVRIAYSSLQDADAPEQPGLQEEQGRMKMDLRGRDRREFIKAGCKEASLAAMSGCFFPQQNGIKPMDVPGRLLLAWRPDSYACFVGREPLPPARVYPGTPPATVSIAGVKRGRHNSIEYKEVEWAATEASCGRRHRGDPARRPDARKAQHVRPLGRNKGHRPRHHPAGRDPGGCSSGEEAGLFMAVG